MCVSIRPIVGCDNVIDIRVCCVSQVGFAAEINLNIFVSMQNVPPKMRAGGKRRVSATCHTSSAKRSNARLVNEHPRSHE